MALKTLGQRTFAALAFGALTLHGITTATPEAGPQPGGGEVGGWPFPAKRRRTENDEALLLMGLI